ncbi:hypothetical protein [Desulfobotulus mexicanus]|nr:hypothetical protein [Desulfobotulus mexicanus]
MIRLEQDNRNGIQSESRLIMFPAPEEYRTDNWKIQTVSVKIPEQPGEDGRMLALKTAWERLLIEEGTRSITGRSESFDRHLQSRLTLRYEGVITEPIRIISFVRENDHLHLTLETKFSPLAFPEDWEKLRKKRTRKENIKDILSVFQ